MEGITTITFDLWDTLYIDDDDQDLRRKEYRFKIMQKIFTQQGYIISNDTLQQAIIYANKVAKETWHTLQKTFGAKERFDIILDCLKINLDNSIKHEAVVRIENAGYDFPPIKITGIENILRRLSKKYKLGLISDTGQTSGRVLREILKKDCIYDYFLVHTFSDEIGVSKPNKKIFELTLKNLCSLPSSTVHIGDNIITDVSGAINYGLKVIHITDKKDNEYSNHRNYYQVDKISDIIEYLNP